MMEIPIIGAVVMVTLFFTAGMLLGRMFDDVTRDGRRKRALARVTPTWEVHLGSDGRDYGYGVVSAGEAMVISVRKVRRAGRHFELLQKVEVARVRGGDDPDKILTAVDRAQAMVSTLALTGAA